MLQPLVQCGYSPYSMNSNKVVRQVCSLLSKSIIRPGLSVEAYGVMSDDIDRMDRGIGSCHLHRKRQS